MAAQEMGLPISEAHKTHRLKGEGRPEKATHEACIGGEIPAFLIWNGEYSSASPGVFKTQIALILLEL